VFFYCIDCIAVEDSTIDQEDMNKRARKLKWKGCIDYRSASKRHTKTCYICTWIRVCKKKEVKLAQSIYTAKKTQTKSTNPPRNQTYTRNEPEPQKRRKRNLQQPQHHPLVVLSPRRKKKWEERETPLRHRCSQQKEKKMKHTDKTNKLSNPVE